MNEKMMNVGYEDTDEKVEIYIYGLKFEINKEKILEKDIENIEVSNIEEDMNDVLGDGAVEKINNKRILDGYTKMTIDVELKILSYVYARYIETATNPVIENYFNVIEKQKNKVLNMYTQKNEKNNYKRNRRNKYRRY